MDTSDGHRTRGPALRKHVPRVPFRQLLPLARPTARTIRCVALAGGAVGAQLVIWASRSGLSPGGPVSLQPLRVAAVVLCLGAAFILDDDAGATVEPSVASLVVRRGLRLALALPVLGVCWGSALWAASHKAASGHELAPHALPVAGLALEAAALLAVTLAAAAVASRRLGHRRGGVAGGPALLAFVLAALSIGPYWPLFPAASSDPGWAAAHVRWALVLAAATIVLVAFSLDPARRRRILPAGRPRALARTPGAGRAAVGGKP
jgi:fluoroquinolone transport system permease protein